MIGEGLPEWLLQQLQNLRSKYFPVKIRDLEPESKQDRNFRTILQSVMDMMKFSGRMEIFEFLMPLLREEMNEKYK